MNQVVDMLTAQRRCRFEQLFEGLTTRYDLVVTFLALLEMAKMQRLRIYQADPEAPIHLEYREAPADGTLHDPDEQDTVWTPSSGEDGADHDLLAGDWRPDDGADDADSDEPFEFDEDLGAEEDEELEDEGLSLHDADGISDDSARDPEREPHDDDDTDDEHEGDL